MCDNYKKPSKETSPAPLTEDGVLANEILNFFITNTKIYFIESEKGERISTFTKKRKKKDKKIDIDYINFRHHRRYAWGIHIGSTDPVIYRELNNIYINPLFDIKALHEYLKKHFKDFPAPSK